MQSVVGQRCTIPFGRREEATAMTTFRYHPPLIPCPVVSFIFSSFLLSKIDIKFPKRFYSSSKDVVKK